MKKKIELSDDLIDKIAAIHQKHPQNSKLIEMCKKEGIQRKYVTEYLNNYVIRDQKPDPPKYIPIVSKAPGAYQMDTFINQKGKTGCNFLMIINVNTRKAYAYPMNGKGAAQVKEALNKFIKEVPDVRFIYSDQDAAYLSYEITDWMKEHNIEYRTTEDDNHNNLGIINRFMRTIRDMAANKQLVDPDIWDHFNKTTKDFKHDYTPKKTITPEEMEGLISGYNALPHKAIYNKAPNDVTLEDEKKYIREKKSDLNPYDYKQGDKVRLVVKKPIMGKMRRVTTNEAYTIDSRKGNLFSVIATNKSVNAYPGYQLVKLKGKAPMGKSLKNDKRYNVQKIISYNKQTKRYYVLYEDGDRRYIPPSFLREGNPLTLSRTERIFWLERKNEIPPEIRKYI